MKDLGRDQWLSRFMIETATDKGFLFDSFHLQRLLRPTRQAGIVLIYRKIVSTSKLFEMESYL